MTTFEIIVSVAIIVIVVLLMRQKHRNTKINERYVEQLFIMGEILSGIRGDTIDILQELNNIEDNNDRGFKNLTDIVDKMHRNLCVEIADKMVDRVYPPTRTIKVKGKRCELTDEELMKRISEDNKEE